MRIVYLVLFLGITLCVSSQKHVFLHVTPKIENQPFALNTVYSIQNGPTIRFDHFNYYFSDVRYTTMPLNKPMSCRQFTS